MRGGTVTQPPKHFNSSVFSFSPHISSLHKLCYSDIFPSCSERDNFPEFRAFLLLLMIGGRGCMRLSAEPGNAGRLALPLVSDCSRWGCHTLHYREETASQSVEMKKAHVVVFIVVFFCRSVTAA